jgi:hypothetical protein
LQEVEAVAEPERACLRVQRAARAYPVEDRVPRHFGHELVAERAQITNRAWRRHDAIVGERHVDPARGELGGNVRDVAGGRNMDNQADVGLVRFDLLERMDVEDLARERRDLVGRGHPRADAE